LRRGQNGAFLGHHAPFDFGGDPLGFVESAVAREPASTFRSSAPQNLMRSAHA
jgi:hypothetical protein